MNEGALFVDVSIEESENVDATIQDVMEVPGSGGGTGTTDYRQLSNLPSLNGRKNRSRLFPRRNLRNFRQKSGKCFRLMPLFPFHR